MKVSRSFVLLALFALLSLATPAVAEEANLMKMRVDEPSNSEPVLVLTQSPTGEIESVVLEEVLSVDGLPLEQFRESIGSIPIGPRGPDTTEPTPIMTAPPGAVVVYLPDPKCSPSIETVKFPDQAKVACVALEARLAVNRMGIPLGEKSPCYLFYGTLKENCMSVAAYKEIKVAYGMSPRHVVGYRMGVLWEGCAVGISGNPIFVSLHDPSNIFPLIAWESCNEQVWKALGRLDLTDGPLVNLAKNEGLRACGL